MRSALPTVPGGTRHIKSMLLRICLLEISFLAYLWANNYLPFIAHLQWPWFGLLWLMYASKAVSAHCCPIRHLVVTICHSLAPLPDHRLLEIRVWVISMSTSNQLRVWCGVGMLWQSVSAVLRKDEKRRNQTSKTHLAGPHRSTGKKW